MDPLETGKRIQMLRKELGWTQKELAEKLYVTDRSVSKWERGLNYPDMAMLEPLATALGTTVVYLLGIEDMPAEGRVEAVTAVAVEETERLKQETRERGMYGMISTILIFAVLFFLGRGLIGREIYGLPLNLCNTALSMIGFHFASFLWIWWKYRK